MFALNQWLKFLNAETKGDAWKALWTISLHKVFAAVAMGIALLRMMPNRPLLSCASYAFAFAISSPVGIAIGIIIDATTQGRVADWIYAISMGLACGVFIYVSINHLIAKGYKPQTRVAADSPMGRWLAVTLGVAVISVVMIWDTWEEFLGDMDQQWWTLTLLKFGCIISFLSSLFSLEAGKES